MENNIKFSQSLTSFLIFYHYLRYVDIFQDLGGKQCVSCPYHGFKVRIATGELVYPVRHIHIRVKLLIKLLAQLVQRLISDQTVVSLIPVLPHTFLEIDHKLFSTVILLLPGIQKVLLSFTSERTYTTCW